MTDDQITDEEFLSEWEAFDAAEEAAGLITEIERSGQEQGWCPRSSARRYLLDLRDTIDAAVEELDR
jgi:hypothetical protein